MSTKLEKLDEQNWQSLHDLATMMYLDGQCYEFAAALYRDLDWKMLGIFEGDVIRHVMVQPHGEALLPALWDIRGTVPRTEWGKPFGMTGSLTMKYVTLEELRAIRPVTDEAIDRASLMAQALWPELPWKKNTFQCEALAFMADLEALCRKHKVWIRAPYPAAQIVLGKAYGDEKGFKVSPTLDGQYFFDRMISGHD